MSISVRCVLVIGLQVWTMMAHSDGFADLLRFIKKWLCTYVSCWLSLCDSLSMTCSMWAVSLVFVLE
jgi:hypothetical protein